MSSAVPRCADCRRRLEVGDRYIEGTASDYIEKDVEPEIASLMADILGGDDSLDGSTGGRIIHCVDCTKPGGKFVLKTYYGDEDEEAS